MRLLFFGLLSTAYHEVVHKENSMLQQIAKTEFYLLSVDVRKKRIYNTVFGMWGEHPEISRFIQDWDNVLKYISQGYTMLTDATQFRLLSAEWATTTIRTRKRLVEAGITKIAEVLPENAFIKMQFGAISERTDIQTKIFSNKIDAEAWLDSREESGGEKVNGQSLKPVAFPK
jgi:hypothetical protein